MSLTLLTTHGRGIAVLGIFALACALLLHAEVVPPIGSWRRWVYPRVVILATLTCAVLLVTTIGHLDASAVILLCAAQIFTAVAAKRRHRLIILDNQQRQRRARAQTTSRRGRH
ncbi:hypothetical protein [Jatrophihabitans lederbergiae]|uniref:Uncharacterized protein n=1 Tax=Jatrophihabitans lederbergiae TaxID=3075547 RepID=A0ABU2JHR4_9ACTN|nr:hypothetical protein [Jatrophihabitans sp. DSM 44399]MDT0264522.1 hypothetical protein [Jatrophihabitans sp. DSM 44399]